jgi:FkbM family methyltransferase
VWERSPFAHLVSPVTLPDGNRMLWSWMVNAFWFRELVKEIYEDRVYERLFRVDEGDVVVDVGANVGTFTLKAWKETGEKGKIFAFEPESRNYKRLCRNLRINRCANVVPINAAVSDFNGTADFYVKEVSLQNTLLPETTLTIDTHTVTVVKVPVRTVSSVLEDFGMDRIDFLKVDAEGAEFEVLRGVEKLMSDRKIGKVSVATYHSKEQTKIISDFLKNLGYQVRVFRNEGLGHFHLEHVYGIPI